MNMKLVKLPVYLSAFAVAFYLLLIELYAPLNSNSEQSIVRCYIILVCVFLLTYEHAVIGVTELVKVIRRKKHE